MTTDEKLLVEYLGGAKPVMVEFYDSRCAKCLSTIQTLTELRDKFHGEAYVMGIDVNTNGELVEKYHLHSYPTFILFKDGQEVWRDGGVKPLSELTDMIHRFE